MLEETNVHRHSSDEDGEKKKLINSIEQWYHPNRGAYRFTILLLACLMCCGVYTSYDSVGAISPYLRAGMTLSQGQYSTIVAVYALPNVVLAFLGGILIDRIGYNKSSILFSFFVVLGNVVIAFGADSYYTIVAGRFLFGLGGESLIVSQTTILTRWFTNKELGLAFGFSLSAGMFGSVVAYWTLPSIAETSGYQTAFWFSAIICMLSFAFTVILALMDYYARLLVKEEIEYEKTKFSWQLFDVRGLPTSYWLTVGICLCFYAAMVFTTYSSDFLYTAYGSSSTSFFVNLLDFDENSAAKVTSIIYFAATIFSPLIGWFVDAYGMRIHLLVFGSIIMIPAFFFLAVVPMDPIPWIVLLGIAYSVVPSVLWTIIPLVVNEKMAGKAFGLSYSLYDGVIFATPLVFGAIHESSGNYTRGLLMFAALSAVGSALCWPLWKSDKDNVLKKPSPGATTIGQLVNSCNRPKNV